MFFFFNDTATTEIYTLSLHDALPIFRAARGRATCRRTGTAHPCRPMFAHRAGSVQAAEAMSGGKRSRIQRSSRSEEHTSELQSRQYLVCRLLLEKKKKNKLTAHQDTP